MLRVGLSGGIGSGKSCAAQRFSELGAVVIDADQLAREVVAAGSEGLAAIVDRFGDDILEEDGSLNRAALGALVFADDQARRDLEQLTHPRIAARTAELVAAAPADAVVVHDVPLLVEKHYGPAYHLVVIVGADQRTRLRRLMESRGMTEDDVRGRMAAQATEEERRAAADVWLENGGTRGDLLRSVDALWHERLVPFEHNVRHGIPSRRSERLQLVPHNPLWSAQARRLCERLVRAGGETVVAVEHIGSTAVPGLLAKDVIDLQVGVRSLADADRSDFLSRVAAAGFPRVEGEWWDQPFGGDLRWDKRMHGNADVARVAHVHVRELDGAAWRWALLFRDWMRADPQARDGYADEKVRISGEVSTTTDYAAAKEPWFAGVDRRAEEWARQRGWEPVRG
jgi:dephospho-CoA kinase